MRIRGVIDLEEFFALVDSCKGRVELVTEEGDRFNLNSKISQCVAVTKLFSKDNISEVEVIASDSIDEKKIVAFLTND